MAFASTHQPIAAPLFNRISVALSNMRQSRQDNRMFRKTLSELRSLSNRELHDLGLSRSSLFEVARASVYSK